MTTLSPHTDANQSESTGSMTTVNDPFEVLQRVFGYSSFRGHQLDVIETVLSDKNAFVLMPTGGGKSLCYQVPALCGQAPVIVISPLIALMENQVAALNTLGVAAAYLNSSLSPSEATVVCENYTSGKLALLYLAPERLVLEGTQRLFEIRTPKLFAIDEAHCLSQWGHDFREDYLALSMLAARYPEVPRIALTATADGRTRDEIASYLEITQSNGKSFVESFDRPNIFYDIAASTDRRQELLQFIREEHSGETGIVYCLTRKTVDEVADFLKQQEINAYPYHAGMDAPERLQNQKRFLQNEGVVIVATIAFGMGIDKPDVRFVAHLNLPKNIEAYSQETGRAGRDGKPAVAWMRYSLKDIISLRHMMRESNSSDLHKNVVSNKLESMLGFAEMTECRRHCILAYFGEHSPSDCNNCDNCCNPPETYDATEIVQKALSCVYRTGQRYGVRYVIDVLTGQNNERILRAEHDQISTFGIGAEVSVNEWQSVFRQIISRGLLYANLESYGTLQLTEKARPVLRGEQNISLRIPPARKSKSRKNSKHISGKKVDSHLDQTQQALFDILKETRRRIASEESIPPYLVCHDTTLLEICVKKPTSINALLQINGIGEKKAERFGEALLTAIVQSERSSENV